MDKMKKQDKPKKPVGFKHGGPTSMDRKKYGRNMACVMNQRGTSRGR